MDRIRSYLFGFMYEEMELEDSIDYYRNHRHDDDYYHHHHSRSFWQVAAPLSISLALQSMATSMIYSILSSMGHDMIQTTTTTTTDATTATYNQQQPLPLWQIQEWVQQIVSVSLYGTAMGKFANGPVVDMVGARRTAIAYTTIMGVVLLSLGLIPIITHTTRPAMMLVGIFIFIMEFVSSVQWPCTIVILATHYRSTPTNNNSNDDDWEDENRTAGITTATTTTPMNHSSYRGSRPCTSGSSSVNSSSWYESGISITSLSSRIGSMAGILCSSYLLSHYQMHWRTIVYVAAYLTAMSVSINYLYVRDSNTGQNVPQNPIDPNLYVKWFPEQVKWQQWSFNRLLRLLMFIVQTNVLPSVRHILGSSTFWIVTLSHTGSSMVRTCQRLLGSYFLMTSDGTLSYEQAVSYSIWYSTGTVLGLFIAGTIFTKGCRNDRQRKYMILRLYIVTIASCYILSIAAIPQVRQWIQAPELIRIIQTMAVTTIGFGVAVQLYHIPSLVGATFGCDKGLFVSYNDGVAYVFVAIVWRYIGRDMQVDSENGGDNDVGGGGWAYGWAAVALLLIVSAFLMFEFMEHYFCRPKYGYASGGTYETIIFS